MTQKKSNRFSFQGIFKITILYALMFFGVHYTHQTVNADTIPVCSGCKYETIAGGIAAATDNNTPSLDLIDVQSSYDETGESFPLYLNKSVKVDCSHVATIGVNGSEDEIYISDTQATIEDCALNQVIINVQTSDFTLNSNDADTTYPTMILANTDDADGMVISNNTGLNGISLNGEIDRTTISNNTFEIRANGSAAGITMTGAITDAIIDGNTVSNYHATRGGYSMITMSGTSGNPAGTGNEITNNVIDFPTQPTDNGGGSLIDVWSNAGVTISDNYISMLSGTTGSSNAIAIVSEYGNTDATVRNNTIKLNSSCGFDCRGIYAHDFSSSNTLTINAEYNLFYIDSPLGSERVEGIMVFKDGDLSTVNVTDSYNGYYNTSHALELGGTYDYEISSTSSNQYTSNPALMTSDASITNDMHPFPASCYFEVNGNQDIGAYGNATGTDKTRSTIYVGPSGSTINYTSIDFDNLNEAFAAGCAATPNINVASGSYPGPVSIDNKSGLTVTGAGSGSTTISASGVDYGIDLNNVDSSNFSGFTISGDTSTTAALNVSNGSDSNTFSGLILSGVSASASGVVSTNSPFTYNTNDYTFTGGDPGTLFVWGTGANDFSGVTNNYQDVSSFANIQDWNVGLVLYSGLYLTFYADNAYFTTAASLDSYLENTLNGGLGAGTVTVECWATNVLDYDSGAYTYNAPTSDPTDCPGTAPTVVSGFQTPPSIYFPQTKGALIFSSSDSNQISSSTIQNNAYGILFTGSAASNTINSTTSFSTNSAKDLYTSSTGDNTVSKCAGLSFTIDGSGTLTGCFGATLDVCDTCTYQTIAAAVADAIDGNENIIDVRSGYDPTDANEIFPINIDKSTTTIQCNDTEIIGDIDNNDQIQITDANITIQDCQFDYVAIEVSASDFTLDSNTGNTSRTIAISTNNDDADNLTITNNTGLNGVSLSGILDTIDISNNTFEIRSIAGGIPKGVNIYESTCSDITISGNTMTWYETNLGGDNAQFITSTGDNLAITNNTFNFNALPGETGTDHVLITYGDGNGATITGNYIEFPSGITSDRYLAFQIFSSGTENSYSIFKNNTIKVESPGGGHFINQVQHPSGHNYTFDIDIQYNAIFSETYYPDVTGMLLENQNESYMTTFNIGYNGFYNIGDGIDGIDSIGPGLTVNNIGGDEYDGMNPGMMLEDAISTNDLQPYPASCYFDVNGTANDIGAYGTAGADRTRDTIYVDDTGTPDYSTHDFTTFSAAQSAMCPSASLLPVDTLNVAAGSYTGPVSFSDNSGLTITGAGSGTTTIDASGQTYGLNLNNVDSSTISGFTISGDSGTTAALNLSNGSDSNIFTDLILSGVSASALGVTSTNSPFTYNSNDYTFSGGSNPGIFYVYGTGANDFAAVETNDQDVSAYINTQSWNVGLVTYMGSMYLTMFADASLFTTAASLDSHLENTLSGGLGADSITVDCWDTNVLAYNGSYTYNAPASDPTDCPGTAPTVVTGFQDPPNISFQQSKGSLIFSNSDSNQISSSTIQNNAYGVLFTGTSGSNTIGSSMTFSSNSTKDLYTVSSEDNTITDCTGLTLIVDGPGTLIGCVIGALSVEIVDGTGNPVISPSFSFPTKEFSFVPQTSEVDLGTASQRIRVTNTTAAPAWTLSLAATDGATAFWDGTTADYDYNDPTANAEDGADTDSLGGQMSVDILWASVIPESGCTAIGISKGSAKSFNEATQNSITLVNASASAMTDCYFETIGVDLSQTIPAEQAADTYNLDMTLTVTAV